MASADPCAEGASIDAARDSLWSAEDRAAFKAATLALETVQANGGDKFSEELLVRRLRALNKKYSIAKKPLAVDIRAAALRRSAADEAARKEAADREHQIQLSKMKLKRFSAEAACPTKAWVAEGGRSMDWGLGQLTVALLSVDWALRA